MTPCRLPFALMLMLALLPLPAPSAPPTAEDGASAPPSRKPPPRLLSPAEKRDSATAPGELRPERPVQPQLSIPLGKRTTGEPKGPTRALRPEPAASAGSVGDAVARCEAQSDEAVRASCRAALRRPG